MIRLGHSETIPDNSVSTEGCSEVHYCATRKGRRSGGSLGHGGQAGKSCPDRRNSGSEALAVFE